MIDHIPTRDKAIILGLYLSKYDELALNELGFTGYYHAFNVLGYSIGAKPASIKNYRDEFDPYFTNNRKGWHKRNLRQYCKDIMDAFGEVQFLDFTEYVKSIIIQYYNIEKTLPEFIRKDASESIAKRLSTGFAAEEYFKVNYHKTSEFVSYELVDTRMLACGFDLNYHHLPIFTLSK